MRYALWDIKPAGTGTTTRACGGADEEQKRIGWEMWVRMEKIIATVLHEAHERQVGEAMEALEEGPEGFYRSSTHS